MVCLWFLLVSLNHTNPQCYHTCTLTPLGVHTPSFLGTHIGVCFVVMDAHLDRQQRAFVRQPGYRPKVEDRGSD
ncbi:hypothetical protein B0O80DRAFT_461979 [Mortierella sp. GBAus27b]|nr:hypothetical protein B0O80DRAFT_461979 [Mortierella sp. GBAus27b]